MRLKEEYILIQSTISTDKVALVTGAARRVGAAITRLLHEAGYRVVIHYNHSKADAMELADGFNRKRKKSAMIIQADLADSRSPAHLIQSAVDWGGRLDLLVNNASIFKPNELEVMNLNNWNALFDINVRAPYALSLAARPYLATQFGSIINLTDINVDRPLKNYSVYCQSKAALVMQTKALAKEFAPEVRVNAVAPGSVAWPEEENSLSLDDQQKIIAATPLQRHGDPFFIAQAVLALADNAFITGQILRVDGGRSI